MFLGWLWSTSRTRNSEVSLAGIIPLNSLNHTNHAPNSLCIPAFGHPWARHETSIASYGSRRTHPKLPRGRGIYVRFCRRIPWRKSSSSHAHSDCTSRLLIFACVIHTAAFFLVQATSMTPRSQDDLDPSLETVSLAQINIVTPDDLYSTHPGNLCISMPFSLLL